MFKRIAFYKVKQIMDNYQIPILVGLRRTGKTTILKQLHQEYDKSVIINFDDLALVAKRDIELFSFIENHILAGANVLLLDEVQIRPNWDLFVKNLFDKYVADKKIKVVVTGSSSLIFEGKDTGVNRTKKVLISTLDFQEYRSISNVNNTYEEFEKYLGRGAYPQYVNQDISFSDLMSETLKPILLNDIAGAYKVQTLQIVAFLYYLSRLSSGEFSRSSASRDTNISATQIDMYLEILEKTQIIKIVDLINEKGLLPKYRRFKVYINPHFHLWLIGKEFFAIEPRLQGHIIESYWLFAATQINGYYKKFFYLKSSESDEEIDFVSLNQSGTPVFKTLHEFKYSDSAISKHYKMLSIIPSLNKVVWCKESKESQLIKFESIKDYKNEEM